MPSLKVTFALMGFFALVWIVYTCYLISLFLQS